MCWEIAWASTEEYIVTTSEDGVIRKWSNLFECPTMYARSTQEHKNAALEWSPDDRLIASVSVNTAKLWDASNLSLLWECSGFWCHGTAFHSLGHRFFYFDGCDVCDVNIEDTGNCVDIWRKLDNSFYRVAFNPSGSTFVARTEQGVKTFIADSFEEQASLPFSSCMAMQYTPDGEYIVLVLETKRVVLWDVARGRAAEDLLLDLDCTTVWNVEISKNCRVIQLRSGGKSYLVRLNSMYY
jgi:WD40 repeat protein